MNYQPINIKEKFSLFSEHWSPKILANINDYNVKIAKLCGDFIWHKHDNTDELFLVISGELRIDFPDGSVILKSGEMFVVPKGLDHKPYAENECEVLLIEPIGTINTGNIISERTVEFNDKI